MKNFKTQFRGYKKQDVDLKVSELNEQIDSLNKKIEELQQQNDKLNEENVLLDHRVRITDKTNEEIIRLALKEASDLIEKAKRNANMILKESMQYVKNLGKEVETYKDEAKDFRAQIVKISEEMIETIDKSEIFSLINEEENTKKETVNKESL